jgi:hypothetical protein
VRRDSSKPSSPKEINEDMAAIQERIDDADRLDYMEAIWWPLKKLLKDISPGLAILLINIDGDGDIMPLGVSLLPREPKQKSWIVQTFPDAPAAMKKKKKAP